MKILALNTGREREALFDELLEDLQVEQADRSVRANMLCVCAPSPSIPASVTFAYAIGSLGIPPGEIEIATSRAVEAARRGNSTGYAKDFVADIIEVMVQPPFLGANSDFRIAVDATYAGLRTIDDRWFRERAHGIDA